MANNNELENKKKLCFCIDFKLYNILEFFFPSFNVIIKELEENKDIEIIFNGRTETFKEVGSYKIFLTKKINFSVYYKDSDKKLKKLGVVDFTENDTPEIIYPNKKNSRSC